MTQQPADTAAFPEPDRQDESVKDSLARLYQDGRAYASAELERQKLRAAILAIGARDAVIFGLVGAVLAFASLIALLVGLILTLTPRLGAGWATLAVVGIAIIISLIFVWVAKKRIDRVRKDIA